MGSAPADRIAIGSTDNLKELSGSARLENNLSRAADEKRHNASFGLLRQLQARVGALPRRECDEIDMSR